jgi:prephenate dehydrogenase
MTKIQSLASTIAIMVAALFYVAGIERDVAVLEANQSTMQRQILEYQEDNKEMFDKIDGKLDQMITIIHSYQTSSYTGRPE